MELVMTMAPIKRKKSIPDEAGSRHAKKRVKLADADRTNDQDRKTTKVKAGRPREPEQSAKSKTYSDPSAKLTTLAYLRDEEPSFPRGGGTILTPLERKQIQIQATRDVLFEQKDTDGADGIDSNEEDTTRRRTAKLAITKSRKAKVKSKNKKRAEPETPLKQGVRIEGLNFKVHPLNADAREKRNH